MYLTYGNSHTCVVQSLEKDRDCKANHQDDLPFPGGFTGLCLCKLGDPYLGWISRDLLRKGLRNRAQALLLYRTSRGGTLRLGSNRLTGPRFFLRASSIALLVLALQVLVRLYTEHCGRHKGGWGLGKGTQVGSLLRGLV